MYFQYGEKIRLKDFADSQHIDSFYASRLFKNIMGTGFQDNLNNVRIDRAELFLLGTDLPIQEISEELGFSSYDYFNKNFKQVFGKSASSYRKENKPLTYPNKDMDTEPVTLSESQLKSMLTNLKFTQNENQNNFQRDVMEELLDNVFAVASEHGNNDENIRVEIEDNKKSLIIKSEKKEYRLSIMDKS